MFVTPTNLRLIFSIQLVVDQDLKMFCAYIEKKLVDGFSHTSAVKSWPLYHVCNASRSIHSPAVSVLKLSWSGACFPSLWSARPPPAQPTTMHCLSPVLLQGTEVWHLHPTETKLHKPPMLKSLTGIKKKKTIQRVSTRVLRGVFFNAFKLYHQ